MKRATRIILFVVVLAAAGFLHPVARNVIATREARAVVDYEARLVVSMPTRSEFGPVRLNQDQRKRLLSVLDWDYMLLGRAVHGVPSCLETEELEFRAAGPRPISIGTAPNCGTFGFSGPVVAWGWSPDAKDQLGRLRAELFPCTGTSK